MWKLSERGDPLEKLAATVEFEIFRPELAATMARHASSKRGRPGFDQTEDLLRDRLSWMRLCGLGLGNRFPDTNAHFSRFGRIARDVRETLSAAGALDNLFARLDLAICEAGYLPVSGQIFDATLVATPRRHSTEAEKARIKAGEKAGDVWPKKP